ncbi:MAG TPA: hypothetical protein VGQ84_14405 [Gaiellaceae bacterium]|nr:hypothetical protein [Gaiellaceae bacterium]
MNRVLPLLVIALGIAVVVRTLIEGVGGGLGLLLGVLLIAAGAGRLYLARRLS